LDNVHGENVTIPKWVRGEEFAYMIQPRHKKLNMLGLGSSIGGNITGEVIVVSSFDDLKLKASQGLTQGKIIVYNQQCDWINNPVNCYGDTAGYRVDGASEAAKVGGIGSLIRSLASLSINSPHTGVQNYQDGVPQIPTACITVEDAEMMARMQDRGETIIVNYYMEARNYPDVTSQNVVAEVTGSTYPDEIVLVSGHLDSWDVGQGALDDGDGAFISWQALSYLVQLNIRPKRTLRLVMWSCEEFGGIGAQQYFDRHSVNISKMDLVMESDMGVFHPTGIEFTGNAAATEIMQEIAQLLQPINTTLLTTGGDGTDISPWMNAGVPGASLANENDRYFYFHHSDGDTMTVLNSDDLDLAAVTWAVTALSVANLDDLLPR